MVDLRSTFHDAVLVYCFVTSGLRKSIIVDDRRLPVGWSKHAIRRQGGTSAGKWDVFLVRFVLFFCMLQS